MKGKGKKIYWIGFMASGKSTLGKRLARDLGWEWMDTDALIEKKYGLIDTIFRLEGETTFRENERQVLHNLPDGNLVVSTGGGLPCFFDNMLQMLQRGLVIHADTPFDVIVERLEKTGGKNDRPLAASASRDELKALYMKRGETYFRAHLTFQPNDDWSDFLEKVKRHLT
ncbi:MAG: shikimate kinase [Saprospirales bacterium]|nr:MAG: shikimate kinase [Saprospirales bacterium]